MIAAPIETIDPPRIEVILGLVAIILALAVALLLLARLSLRGRGHSHLPSPRRIEEIAPNSPRPITGDAAERLMHRLELSEDRCRALEHRVELLEALLPPGAIDNRPMREVNPGSVQAPPSAREDASRDPSELSLSTLGEPHIEPKTQDILRLAESGFTPVEIARRLDETTGAVQLVLALHRAEQSTDQIRTK